MAQAVATVLVAIIGLIGIIVQTRSNNKLKKQKDILDDVYKVVSELKKESKKDDERLNKKIDSIAMDVAKRFLIVEMTKLVEGAYKPSEEQKRVLYETKEIYNDLGRRQLC